MAVERLFAVTRPPLSRRSHRRFDAQGDKSDLPVYPGHGAVTHAQRDSADLARIRIRQNQRQLRDDDSVDVQNAPPLPVYNRALLEAHRAEKVARARRQEQTVRLALRDKHRLTRTIAGELEKEFEEESGGGQDADRWEARRREPSPSGSDDSDFEDKASGQESDDSSASSDEKEEGSSPGERSDGAKTQAGEDKGRSDEDHGDVEANGKKDEGDDASEDPGDSEEDVEEAGEEGDDDAVVEANFGTVPKVHRNRDLRPKVGSPNFFTGFSSSFDSWEDFHCAFDQFQRDSFQQFSKRTST
ncbi:hypothetical protein PR003_g16383 [Phytophthora rubi]|uniref:Uncharacterized protein n=1 Tax=Phytophthora rubi TaxID=129364 RepID=A0A6A4ER11_9STRA|nr:hypothetical protein PR003_g16383 [Phytophthora rubi]